MLKYKLAGFGSLGAFILLNGSIQAQTDPVSGLYQIISGTYTECCGFVGVPSIRPLPDEKQGFVKLVVDPQSKLATMTFLAGDIRTVFSTVPCPDPGPIEFSFNFGFLFNHQIVFQVDPGPPPNALYWNYIVSNSAARLFVNGVTGTAQSACADTPTQFTHSNVVAELIAGPRLTLLEPSTNRAVRLLLQGQAGWTNVIEASTDLGTWIPISTNAMDFSECPICPYAIVEDAASTNLMRRYYRAFEFP